MDYQNYILVGTLAFMLWCFSTIRKNSCLKSSLHHQKCQSEMAAASTEIIIVGAGVAGSSLAYALGKVKLCFYAKCLTSF